MRDEDLDDELNLDELQPADLFKPPGYKIAHVALAVFAFYGILAIFGARGLHRWTAKLPVSPLVTKAREATDVWWGRAAAFGFEEPGLTIERAWLVFQEASPLLYPKTYAEIKARRAHAHKAIAAATPVPKKATNGGPSVLLLGDSIMAGIGPVIKNDVFARLGGAADLVAKVATGLSRPDVFDWRGELRRVVQRDHYDVIVMMLGTNDSQDFLENGQILSYGTEEWAKAYNARMSEMMDNACRGADKAYWVGLPPMKSAAFNRKAMRINNWAQKQAALHPCFQYVALDKVVGDDKGSFTSYRKIDDVLEKIRNPDGIHITKRGGSLVSSALIDLLAAHAH
jgi:hypothetical protein